MVKVSDPGTKAYMKAREIFEGGAHFLLGTRGRTPGPTAGLGFALVPPVLDPRAPTICAARGMTARKTSLICGGRPGHPDIVRAGGGFMSGIGGVGRRTSTDMIDYIEHMKMLRDTFGMEQETWTPFKMNDRIALTPRTFFDKAGNADVFLGEDCTGKIHVDCIGLVNACRRAGGAVGAEFSIAQIENGKVSGQNGIVFKRLGSTDQKVPGRAEVQDGDIVIKHEGHIGICGVTKSGEIEVIEATGSSKGIILTRFKNARALDSDKWRTRVRAFF